MGLVSTLRDRRRERLEQEREDELAWQREEEARLRAEEERMAISPFAALPFGSLLERMMLGGGGWTRALELDPRTGEWVDVSDARPEPLPEVSSDGETPGPPPPGPGRAPRRRPRPRPAPPANPSASLLGGQLGGGGGGGGGGFEVQAPEELTTFADVGGMDAVKQEVRDTVGLILQHPEQAERYGIEWNGILLHGPPALENLPCLLFFDKFDSVAQRRSGTPDQESRRTVNQLLTALEASRDERELLVMAASNEIEHLDPAVIRPGRFDRHIRVDLPEATKARMPTVDVRLDELARETEGLSPADLKALAQEAGLAAMSRGETASVTHEDFREGISRLRGSAATRAGSV